MAARSSSLQSLAKTSAPVMPLPSNVPLLAVSFRVAGISLGIWMEGIAPCVPAKRARAKGRSRDSARRPDLSKIPARSWS